MENTVWRKHVLLNGKEIRLCMSKDEIQVSYRDCKHKDQQIKVLAELNSVTSSSMALYLAELGFDNCYIRNFTKCMAKRAKDALAASVTEKAPSDTEKAPSVTEKAPSDTEKAASVTENAPGGTPAEKPRAEEKKATDCAGLLDDTLALLSNLEDEYRYCCIIIEGFEERKSKLKESIDALAIVYHNVEEIAKEDK